MIGGGRKSRPGSKRCKVEGRWLKLEIIVWIVVEQVRSVFDRVVRDVHGDCRCQYEGMMVGMRWWEIGLPVGRI